MFYFLAFNSDNAFRCKHPVSLLLARIHVEETTQRNILYLMSFYYTAPKVSRSHCYMAATTLNYHTELPNLTNFLWDSRKLDKSHVLPKVQWISRIFVNTLCVHVCTDYLMIEFHSSCTYMYKKFIIVYICIYSVTSFNKAVRWEETFYSWCDHN